MSSSMFIVQTILALILALSSSLMAQTPATPSPAKGVLSYPNSAKVVYETDRNTTLPVDMYFGDWHESLPNAIFGSLIVRAVLSRGDNFFPPRKGAIIAYPYNLWYATLEPGASTVPTKLAGEQDIFYVMSGNGKMSGGGETIDLVSGTAVLMPAGLEFVITSSGSEPLIMYVINESIPKGFRPNDKMLVKQEATSNLRPVGHWAHIVRELFGTNDGLGVLQTILTVAIDPLTLGEPHPHRLGQEEGWAAIEGSSLAFMGTQLRLQRPGMAYMVRPDGKTVHSNINFGDKRIKFLYFSCSGPHELRK
jgi:mannose-6-phosphate isomerase-like protein (cupin superfamily)